ncbi:ABC transporter permease [Kineosporia babensis]|uniref:Iron ABC transporter permease n=1 Tax=Kineosporia babensis TaxID=499548 RepID=A0A9X1NCK3_9ACTN|nr:iron ABC transporter permease [Kineosporia babensis]MCD5311220.1 iron ABC transporter permease [Kineosporia babensis]
MPSDTLKRTLRDPVVLLALGLLAVLAVLVLVPVAGLVSSTLRPEGLDAWRDVLTGRLAPALLHEPLLNSLLVGAVTAIGAVVIGGGLAWVVVMTDVPLRRTITFLASVPFALPSFALALAWESVFRNDLVGGRVGLLTDLGLTVPDWLAWGPVPVSATLIAHYYSLSFLLTAAALATVNSELVEAAELTGASRLRVARSIALPVVLPAVISGALLAFAEGVSNFAAPAVLGLPVRFHTLSTRAYGAITTGQTERGYVLSVVLVVVAAIVLLVSTRLAGRRKSFATITGKGARRKRVRLGAARLPVTAAVLLLVALTSIVPGLLLLTSSLLERTGSFTSGFTTHFWTGASDPSMAQGMAGILRNPQIVSAFWTTLALGLSVAVAASVLGLLLGYVMTRLRPADPLQAGLGKGLALLSYLPFLVPGVALGAAFIAQFGRPIGPLPALYGTFAILVIAGVAATLPFASQAGRSAVGQISPDVEEAATTAGAGLGRRLFSIVLPLSSRGLLAGGVLVFVNIVRDLSLLVLLVTPATPLLSVLTYRYASEGFTQFANAVTVVIVVISLAATLFARRLEGASQPWLEER